MIAINILALMESRVDRLLLVLGLILSLSSGFLLMRPQAVDFSTQSPVIGTLKTSSEVSRRHARSFSWGKIEKESNLFLKDMVYVPPQSSAEVILNSNEKLSLEPDSMVEFDSISSDRFNIVLMQGNAKLTSSNGTTTAVMTQNTEMEVRIPEAEKPQLPMFFIDTKAWELDQSGLIQKMDEQRKTTKLFATDLSAIIGDR
ncbi:hypothetical protein EBT16_12665 [bacterium]|nr:hypothetical protein [bacterium]